MNSPTPPPSERRAQRLRASKRARDAAESILFGIREDGVDDGEDSDEVTRRLRRLRRALAAACEDVSRGLRMLILALAASMIRARRATTRYLSSVEGSGATLMAGPIAAAGNFLVIVTLGSSLLIPDATAVGPSRPTVGSRVAYRSREVSQPVRMLHRETTSVDRPATGRVSGFTVHVNANDDKLKTSAGGNVGRKQTSIDFGRELEGLTPLDQYHHGRTTIECDERSLVASTICTTYDFIPPLPHR